MPKTVLFALTSHSELGGTGRKTGAYAPEFAHPGSVFEDAGYDVQFVSVDGGQVPLDGIKDGDVVTHEFLTRPQIQQALAQTPTANQLDAEDYDVIYFVGGHGTMWDFRNCQPLKDLAAKIYENGGVVAGVCHGPSALVDLKLSDGSLLVDGKKVSSFTDQEEAAVGLSQEVPFLLQSALEANGADHEGAENFQEYAVADGRLVTGQNPASAAKVAELVLTQS